MALKHTVRGFVEAAIAHGHLYKWRRRPSLVILTYHRVLPPSDPRYQYEQPGMVVHPETFELHLRLLKRHFTTVGLAEWLARRGASRTLPPLAAALTFDDGWQDNYEFAYPLLVKHGVPATIFLVSDLLDTGGVFWPEQLAFLLLCLPELGDDSLGCEDWLRGLGWTASDRAHAPSRERMDEIICRAKACYTDAQMRAFLADVPRTARPTWEPRAILSQRQISEMAGSGLVSFGSHTKRHTRLLSHLGIEDLEDEITGSYDVLAKDVPGFAPIFCYPNGDHTPEAERIVEKSYDAAISGCAGWVSPQSDRYLLPRIGVHEDVADTPRRFLARLSGWF